MQQKEVNCKTGKMNNKVISSKKKMAKKKHYTLNESYELPKDIIQLLQKADYSDPTKDKISRNKDGRTHIFHQLFQASWSDVLSDSEKTELLIYTLQFYFNNEELNLYKQPVYDFKSLEDDTQDKEGKDILEAGKTFQQYFREELRDQDSVPVSFFKDFIRSILKNMYDDDYNKNQGNIEKSLKAMHNHVNNLLDIYNNINLSNPNSKKKKIITADELWVKYKDSSNKEIVDRALKLYHTVLNKFLRSKNIPENPEQIKERFALLVYLTMNPCEKKYKKTEKGRRYLSKKTYSILSY